LTDLLVSGQPGLILQISFTNQRVNGSTFFVDHYSDHVYAYLMRFLSFDETRAANHGPECYLSLLVIQSKAYHADNGCFADQGFQDDFLSNDQAITFCGVGSYHQNDIAEKKSKILHLMHVQFYSMPNKCILNIFLLFFGLLHSNVPKIG
jgi:hypothetical protein